eukprot:353934-Chlamydomonas_euryale.AAC.3
MLPHSALSDHCTRPPSTPVCAACMASALAMPASACASAGACSATGTSATTSCAAPACGYTLACWSRGSSGFSFAAPHCSACLSTRCCSPSASGRGAGGCVPTCPGEAAGACGTLGSGRGPTFGSAH